MSYYRMNNSKRDISFLYAEAWHYSKQDFDKYGKNEHDDILENYPRHKKTFDSRNA